ncbi:MAG: hypothetical protein J1D88_05480 [Treponema sp.]|nr:hypothetical protein [Treponema sp.]
MRPFKCVFKICAGIFVLMLALKFVSLTFMRPNTYDRYKTFIKSRTDYDVLFLGGSRVLNAVNPMQLWEDYGITSYNLGWHGATIPLDTWMLKIVQKYHKPKIAIMDIYGLQVSFKDDEGSSLAYIHDEFDNFPLFPTKWQAVLDMRAKPEERAELAFPLYLYHNRWKEDKFTPITENTVKRLRGKYNPHISKGMDFRIAVKSNQFPASNYVIKNRYDGKETTSMEYCRQFIAYCKKNGIVPAFMYVPALGIVSTPASRDNLATWISAFRQILEEEGLLFLDMILPDDIVDFDIDQFDLGAHLNPSGARKVTDAIGKFLTEDLGCQSHKDDESFSSWNDDYVAYRKWLLDTIARQKNFKNLLMMTNHSEVYATVTAASETAFDPTEEKLLFENWSDIRFERTTEAGTKVTVVVYERGTDKDVVRLEVEKK